MAYTRSEFLRLVVLGSGGVLAALSAETPLLAASASQSLAGYQGQIGKEFMILGSGQRLILDAVVEGRKTKDTVEFSLVFRSESPLEAGTYPVRNATLGVFDVFLVGAGSKGYDYFARADFNLLNGTIRR